MPDVKYAAQVAAQWRDFTPQHTRIREQALSIARGEHSVPAGAVVGVYGSGKSTLLFAILAKISEERVLPVWEEASSFLDRLVASTDRVSPQEFVKRVHGWIEDLRTNSDVFAAYKRELEERRLGRVAEIVEEALRQPTERAVLLLDEMEQAYPHFLQRIDTADHQPLRALIDSCGNSQVRLLMAYAPESFVTLGDADRGRMLPLAVPSLNATSIQQAFKLAKGHANFAWWASRGRARGVVKAVEEIIEPHLRGDFEGSWLGLAEALDRLPFVFGVPAVLRDNLPSEHLRDLLNLTPRHNISAPRNDVIEVRDRPTVADRLMNALVDSSESRREQLEVVVDELLDILDAVSDEEHRCFLTFDDFSTAVNLAGARGVESGRLRELPEGIEAGRAFFQLSVRGEGGWIMPFSLNRLADEIFPSPFTDPVLPLADGHLPAQSDIDRLFGEIVAKDDTVFKWKEHDCFILQDLSSLERWLKRELVKRDDNARYRILLLDSAGNRDAIVALAEAAGRISVAPMGRFHSCFIKCLAIRARQEALGEELESVASTFRGRDRQLGRKVEWHISRVGRLLEELDPHAQQEWAAAVAVTRGERLSGVFGRLGEDSPGLLALLYPFKSCRPETRKTLAELGEMLAENSDLRKLARAADPRRQLEGAGVVVDGLLPARSGSPTRRWVESEFAGRRELSRILETFAGTDTAAILAHLLQPYHAGHMERLVRFYAGGLPDLKPERQQLEGLQGINRVMERARSVRKGVQALLGVREDVPGLAIGRLISQAFSAQKTIGVFNRLAGRLDKIEEPWAKALALWVAAVFAERIWDGVEKDEASLKVWETISELGKSLGRAIDDRLDEIRELGFTTIADFILTERSRLKSALSDADQMQAKIQELESALEQIAKLVDALKALRDLAAERRTDISQLLQVYRPQAGRLSDECEAAERVVSLLGRIDDDWPLPGEEDLQAYLERLKDFGEQSYAERLRARLAKVVGVALVSKGVVLDPDDIAEIEPLWQNLSEAFARSYREAIETMPPAGSDKLVVWLKEAIEKETTLAAAQSDERLQIMDAKMRTWATQVLVRPTQLAKVLALRGQVHQFLTNLSRSVSSSVIKEIILTAESASTEGAYTALDREARKFQEELERLSEKLAEIRGSVRRPFKGETRAAVVAELGAACRASEEKQNELHDQLLALGRVVNALGGRARFIPSPLTLPDAERLISAESEDAGKLLEEAWHDLTERAEKLGLDNALTERVEGLNAEAELEFLHSARESCVAIEQQGERLKTMGLALPPVSGLGWEKALETFRLAAQSGREQLEDLNQRIRLIRLRLEALGGPRFPIGESERSTHQGATETLAQIKLEAETVRVRLLGKASTEAQRVYDALVSGKENKDATLAPVVELRLLGLLRTIEDEL